MPCPEYLQTDPQPSLGHVNLMMDTFIANANPEDLRAITRSLLATSPPNIASQFRTIAQSRLIQMNATQVPAALCLFSPTRHGLFTSTPALTEMLNRARSLYGAGMGFASLRLFTEIVRRTIGIRWEEDDEVVDTLAALDSDITQAIQSCIEEIRSRESDMSDSRDIVKELRLIIGESLIDVQRWGGEFPFDRSSGSLECWKF